MPVCHSQRPNTAAHPCPAMPWLTRPSGEPTFLTPFWVTVKMSSMWRCSQVLLQIKLDLSALLQFLVFSCLGVCVWFGCRRTNRTLYQGADLVHLQPLQHISNELLNTPQSTCPSATMSKLELHTIIGIAQYNLLELYSKHKLKGKIRPCLLLLKYLKSSPLSC